MLATIGALLIGIRVFFLPIFIPIPELTGPYSVGITSYHLIDNARMDKRFASGNRELMVHIYYPSAHECQNHKLYSYNPEKINALATIKAKQSFIPKIIWDYALGLYSYAQPNGALSIYQSQYPIVLFLPGIGSESLYTSYLEEIASFGYIIVQLDIPFDTTATVLPNNKIIELDPQFSAAIKAVDRDAIYAHRTTAHYSWLSDINFVLGTLKQLNQDPASIFFEKLNLKRIGVMGHSHGGGVAVDFCAHNQECKACINIDGWTKTTNTTDSIKKPLLILTSERDDIIPLQELSKNMPVLAQKIAINHAGHNAFSDLILLKWPLYYFFDIATKKPLEVREEIIRQILSFFKQNL